MVSYRQELPAVGVTKLDIELWRGSITVRPAAPGEAGSLESDWEIEVGKDGDVLHVRQPVDVRRPVDLADLIGEQRVRIEIEGAVLLDKEIRHGGGDVEIVLPSSVREIRCRTSRGELRLEGIEAISEAYTGRGNVFLSGGRSRASAGTADGDIKVSRWLGPLHVRTGKGNVEVRSVNDDLDAKTGKGEIRVEEARARVEVHTGNGNIVAGQLSGDAVLSTSHGDVVATDIDGSRLQASTGHGRIVLGGKLAGSRVKTGHGDIVCRLDAAEGSHELHTGRGNISLDLGDGVVMRIDASTKRGEIRSNLPLVRVGDSGPEGYFNQRMVGTAPGNGPAAGINLNTKSGDIRIVRRERVGAAATAQGRSQSLAQSQPATDQVELVASGPPAQPEQAEAPEADTANAIPPEEAATRGESAPSVNLELEVLGALSRGEISVDEALLLMEKAGLP